MKAIHTLALIAASAAIINSTPLRASEVMSFNKSHADPPYLCYAAIILGEKTSAPVKERADFPFQGEVGEQMAPQVSPEAGVQPATIRSPKLELRVAKPSNVVQSKNYPGIDYSGILVQSLKSNPLQLFNPFAPIQYGDGEANTFCNLITGRAEGLKVLSIRF